MKHKQFIDKCKKEERNKIAGAIQFAMYSFRNNAEMNFEELSFEQADKILDEIMPKFHQAIENYREEVKVIGKDALDITGFAEQGYDLALQEVAEKDKEYWK